MKLRRDGLVFLLVTVLVLLTVAIGHVMPLKAFNRPGSSATGLTKEALSSQRGLATYTGDFRLAVLWAEDGEPSAWRGRITGRSTSAPGAGARASAAPLVLNGGKRTASTQFIGPEALADHRSVPSLGDRLASLPSVSQPIYFPNFPFDEDIPDDEEALAPGDGPTIIYLPPWNFPLEPEEPTAEGPKDGVGPAPGGDSPSGPALDPNPGSNPDTDPHADPADPTDLEPVAGIFAPEEMVGGSPVSPVPIPGSLLLFGSGLGGVALLRRGRKQIV